jgi:hypothetical protein
MKFNEFSEELRVVLQPFVAAEAGEAFQVKRRDITLSTESTEPVWPDYFALFSQAGGPSITYGHVRKLAEFSKKWGI